MDYRSPIIADDLQLLSTMTNERAARCLVEWFGHYYGNGDLARRVAVWGSAADVASELGKLIEAGAEMLYRTALDLAQPRSESITKASQPGKSDIDCNDPLWSSPFLSGLLARASRSGAT